MADETPTLLDPAGAARLTEFARACKAAARAVVLYPAGHPANVATLGRIVQMTSPSNLPSPMRITVLARYPHEVKRGSLNLGTMLCSIADVYDAMRSQRAYQQAFPSDRILEVLKRSDGSPFDQHLVRRFAQLVGIYPVGNLVRLEGGEMAVVVTVYAPDPHRPHVRVVADRAGAQLDHPRDINLWETDESGAFRGTIAKPLDPREFGIDPLTCL